MTKAEQETTFRWDEEQRVVYVFSANPVIWRRMARFGVTPHGTSTAATVPVGKTYRVPLDMFRWGVRKPGAVKRAGNPEALARARAARAAP